MLIAIPLGIGAAVYLAELAPLWIRPPIAFLVELVAAIPSVIYGLWGIFVLAPILRTWVEPFLGATLGFLPLFQGPPYGVGMLAAGIILAIMVVPYITAVGREILRAVPDTQREAALGLGATTWETTRIAVLTWARAERRASATTRTICARSASRPASALARTGGASMTTKSALCATRTEATLRRSIRRIAVS